jgi:hypothetical protein
MPEAELEEEEVVRRHQKIGGLAPLQTALIFFFRNDFFWQKINLDEKWRKPYERAKQELTNGIWFA